jgi:hypothetical protein
MTTDIPSNIIKIETRYGWTLNLEITNAAMVPITSVGITDGRSPHPASSTDHPTMIIMLVRIPKLIHSYIGANFRMAQLDEFFSFACSAVSGGNWVDWFRKSVAMFNV